MTTLSAPSAAGPGRGTTRRLGPVHRIRRFFGRHPLGLVFIVPYLAFLCAFTIYPIGYAVWMSVHNFRFTAPGVKVPHPYVGLQHYQDALNDPAFWRAFKNVGVFLIINVPLTVILALGLAFILNQALPLRGFFRAAFYIPYVTASVAVITVWLYLFKSDGFVNQILGPLAPSPSWLSNETLAMPVIAVYVAWKQLGFYLMLFLGALQAIPTERYEAAMVDGAGKWRSFLNIAVPGVRPAMLLVVILATITGANMFTEPFLLTGQGGPNGSTTSPVLLVYQQGIQLGHPDQASAIGVMLIIIVLAIVGIQKLLIDRD